MSNANHLGAFEFPQGPKADYRDGSKTVLMARSGGYVMVKHPRCAPFVWTEKQWCACGDFPAKNLAE